MSASEEAISTQLWASSIGSEAAVDEEQQHLASDMKSPISEKRKIDTEYPSAFDRLATMSRSNNESISDFSTAAVTGESTANQSSLSLNRITRSQNSSMLNFDDAASGAAQLLAQKPSTKMVIEWLHDNFEVRPDASISREAVYHEYVKYIEESGYECMNAASFGKLIRSTFPFIQTRRLGVRGQSKYHYHGIGVRAGSYLYNRCEMTAGLNEDGVLMMSPGSTSTASLATTDASSLQSSKSKLMESNDQVSGSSGNASSSANPTSSNGNKARTLVHLNLTEWPSFLLYPFSNELREKLHAWHELHRQHVGKLCSTLSEGNAVSTWPTLFQQFWKGCGSEFSELLQDQAMVAYLTDCDLYFYSLFVNTIMREWWLPLEASSMEMLAEVENNLEAWTLECMSDAPEALRQAKMRMAHAVCLSLHRCRALMSLAERVRPMVREDILITHMISDWRKMDTPSVNEYTCWVNQWQEGFIEAVENDILSMFKRRATIENWITWLNSLVQRCVPFPGLHESYDLAAVEYSAKQFLSRFSLFLSQLIRDFTIRTVPAFGSWHALRLFIDEYIWYITSKNMAVLQFNYYRRYPLWIDGLLWHYLDPQRPSMVMSIDSPITQPQDQTSTQHQDHQMLNQIPIERTQNKGDVNALASTMPIALSRAESMDFANYKAPFDHVLGYQPDN